METMIPHIINITPIGNTERGYISVADLKLIPFRIKRVYWTFNNPNGVIRGHHAHRKLHQVIFAVNGSIRFMLEDKQGTKYEFVLDHPSKGLFISQGHWRTIEMKDNAVLLCLASEDYDESDYIRDYGVFKKEK